MEQNEHISPKDELHNTEKAGELVGKAAMSAVLATSLTAALSQSPNNELIHLADPAPIVQNYVDPEEEPPAPPQESATDQNKLKRERLIRILRALLIALAFAAALLFALARGCSSCAAPLIQQEQEDEQSNEQANFVLFRDNVQESTDTLVYA